MSQSETPRRAGLASRIRWAAGALRLTLTEPGDGLDRVASRVRGLFTGGAAMRHVHAEDPEWERHVHERLGVPWPCETAEQFDGLWSEIVSLLRAQGLAVGRGAYGGWDDGDQALARVVRCLATHLGVGAAVETGVARGVTSRAILDALDAHGAGRLWSIDLPAMDTAIHPEVAAAVPADMRERWTYVSGTSRRRLGPLLRELGQIELFVHDSSHTARNLAFELEHAWEAMRRGAIVADDIDRNGAFPAFVREHGDAPSFVATAGDGAAQFGIVLKGL